MILKKADIYLSMIMDQQDKDLHIMSDRTESESESESEVCQSVNNYLLCNYLQVPV